MAGDLNLPYGFFDARYLLLLQSFIGEFLQGAACTSCPSSSSPCLDTRNQTVFKMRTQRRTKSPCTTLCTSLSSSCSIPGSIAGPQQILSLGAAGGLVFGFNALSLIFKSQDFYNCRQSVAGMLTAACQSGTKSGTLV